MCDGLRGTAGTPVTHSESECSALLLSLKSYTYHLKGLTHGSEVQWIIAQAHTVTQPIKAPTLLTTPHNFQNVN